MAKFQKSDGGHIIDNLMKDISTGNVSTLKRVTLPPEKSIGRVLENARSKQRTRERRSASRDSR